MKKRIFLLLFSVLAGCATPDTYRNMSSMKLCMDYLTYPSYNVNQSARAAELSRRNENCSAYTGAASMQQRNNEQFEKSLRDMQQKR